MNVDFINKRRVIFDIVCFLLFCLVLLWALTRGSEQLGYSWHWKSIPGYLYTFEAGTLLPGPLLNGLLITLKITLWSLLLSAVLGLVTALLRLSDSIVGQVVARLYLELIRNTPLLVQIFFLYFVMAPILDIGRFATAILALSLFEGAYVSEIIRAGITSIDKGQWEAGESYGLSRLAVYRHIILPQALRRILPPLTSQAISLIKDSALVSTIAVYDLTMEGRTIIAETFLTFEIWFTVAGIYLLLTLFLSTLVSILEKRFPQRA